MVKQSPKRTKFSTNFPFLVKEKILSDTKQDSLVSQLINLKKRQLKIDNCILNIGLPRPIL